jgi:succinylglutamic semialdehyde dehydrogenase
MSKQQLYIDGKWVTGGGEPFESIDPASEQVLWQGPSASAQDIDRAVAAADDAFDSWSRTDWATRVQILESFAELLDKHSNDLATVISSETGKPLWDARGEIGAMIKKIPITVQAYQDRRFESERDLGGIRSVTRFRPHGVCAIFGPFNFPGHVPNGHIVPALLAGNTIVFKPSELTPLVAEKTVELWHEVGLPAGVLNLVQGAKETGIALANPEKIDGLFFTGSFNVGRALNQRFADHPGKVLALELGGNNPLIVCDIEDLPAAAYMTIQSAYMTSGQRCTCASRLIIPTGPQGLSFVDRLAQMIQRISVGAYTSIPEPFMGPVINKHAADKLLKTQQDLRDRGAIEIVPMRRLGAAMLTPGLIDVTDMQPRDDVECFGPLLQVIRVADFDAAIDEANNTAYGLAAGLLSDSADLYQQFVDRIQAGVTTWNRPTNGASSSAPFGGIGKSGNHRPTGYYATDYCTYPVASLEADHLTLPETILPGIEL